MKQFLDKAQAQRLIDMGVDMSSVSMSYRGKLVHYNPMTWEWDIITGCFCGKPLNRWYIPTLSLSELIERLPQQINIEHYSASIRMTKHTVIYEGKESLRFVKSSELIDNLYDCYVQLIKDGIIKL